MKLEDLKVKVHVEIIGASDWSSQAPITKVERSLSGGINASNVLDEARDLIDKVKAEAISRAGDVVNAHLRSIAEAEAVKEAQKAATA